jgi:cytochrome P450
MLSPLPTVSHNKIEFDNMHYDHEYPLMYGGKGAWQIYSYVDVHRIITDYEVFSNTYMPQEDNYIIGGNLNQTDPPLHLKLRSLIAQPFTKSAIAKLEDWIKAECKSLIAEHAGKGEMDFANNFAFPLSAAVISKVMGIPSSVHSQINEWAKAIVTGGFVEGGIEIAEHAQQEMFTFLIKLFEGRKSLPQSDFLSDLMNAHIDNKALSIQGKVATCMTLLLAGHETTAALLVNSMHTFIELLPVQEYLREEPQQIPHALNEVLRLKPSLVSMYRKAKHNIEFNGHLIQKDHIVNAWIATANRDPTIFPAPDYFDIGRNNHSQTLSFGYGIHHCIGAVLAKVESRIAFEVIFSMLINIRLKPNSILLPSTSKIVSGFQSLPIVFENRNI